MKYKHIDAAIHNFGHSFLSSMNYVDDDYVVDELKSIHTKGYDIHIDWLCGTFEPHQLRSERITKSIGYWTANLRHHLEKHNVELARLTTLSLHWPASEERYMRAVDDRGKEHKIYVRASK